MPGLRDILDAAADGPWGWMGGYPQRVTNGGADLVAEVFDDPDSPPGTVRLIALAPELAAENLYAAEAIRAIVLDPEFPGRGPMTITRGQKELLADALARLDRLGVREEQP